MPCTTNLALVALWAAMAQGTIYPLDDQVPGLVSLGAPVGWWAGADALLLAGSRCVRVNQRGVATKPGGWSMRDLAQDGWEVRRCVPGGEGSLCVANGSRVFPLGGARFSASHRPGGLRCTRETTARALDHEWGYDVSACDVLDGGGDVVVYDHLVAVRDTGMSPARYWLLCVLAVFVVRCFSYRARRLSGTACLTKPPVAQPDPDVHLGLTTDQWTIAACGLSIVAAVTPNLPAELVTEEDLMGCSFLVVYACLYMGIWVSHRRSPDAPLYNLIGATLHITASRLYKGIETPYTGVLLFVIGTRLIMKLRGPWGVVRGTIMAADCMLVSVLAVYGISFGGVYVVIIGLLAFVTADVLS